jgi:hypothetical protein
LRQETDQRQQYFACEQSHASALDAEPAGSSGKRERPAPPDYRLHKLPEIQQGDEGRLTADEFCSMKAIIPY